MDQISRDIAAFRARAKDKAGTARIQARLDVMHTDAARRERDIATARQLRADGLSLYAIAVQVGRTKEWLRSYAGLTDR